jgi:hypothetical protein
MVLSARFHLTTLEQESAAGLSAARVQRQTLLHGTADSDSSVGLTERRRISFSSAAHSVQLIHRLMIRLRAGRPGLDS